MTVHLVKATDGGCGRPFVWHLCGGVGRTERIKAASSTLTSRRTLRARRDVGEGGRSVPGETQKKKTTAVGAGRPWGQIGTIPKIEYARYAGQTSQRTDMLKDTTSVDDCRPVTGKPKCRGKLLRQDEGVKELGGKGREA